jgi:hypothetical protein
MSAAYPSLAIREWRGFHSLNSSVPRRLMRMVASHTQKLLSWVQRCPSQSQTDSLTSVHGKVCFSLPLLQNPSPCRSGIVQLNRISRYLPDGIQTRPSLSQNRGNRNVSPFFHPESLNHLTTSGDREPTWARLYSQNTEKSSSWSAPSHPLCPATIHSTCFAYIPHRVQCICKIIKHAVREPAAQ